MKKVIGMVITILTIAVASVSCSGSDDSSSSSTSGAVTGKWEYFQTGYTSNGQEALVDYAHNPDCSKDYVEFFANGTMSTMSYEDVFGESCYENDGVGTYTKSGNNLTITQDGETATTTIQVLNATTLKLKGAVENGGATVVIFKKATN